MEKNEVGTLKCLAYLDDDDIRERERNGGRKVIRRIELPLCCKSERRKEGMKERGSR